MLFVQSAVFDGRCLLVADLRTGQPTSHDLSSGRVPFNAAKTINKDDSPICQKTALRSCGMLFVQSAVFDGRCLLVADLRTGQPTSHDLSSGRVPFNLARMIDTGDSPIRQKTALRSCGMLFVQSAVFDGRCLLVADLRTGQPTSHDLSSGRVPFNLARMIDTGDSPIRQKTALRSCGMLFVQSAIFDRRCGAGC